MADITIDEVKEIVEIALDRDLDDFSMDANFYIDYQMDSLGAVALVVEVQKRYGVRIPDGRMPRIQTGNQLKENIEEILAMSPEERERILIDEAEIPQEVMDQIAAAHKAAMAGATQTAAEQMAAAQKIAMQGSSESSAAK